MSHYVPPERFSIARGCQFIIVCTYLQSVTVLSGFLSRAFVHPLKLFGLPLSLELEHFACHLK